MFRKIAFEICQIYVASYAYFEIFLLGVMYSTIIFIYTNDF